MSCWRRSQGSPRSDSRSVILGDTMGELRKFYALSTLSFVGRTLVPMGGSNVIEVAGLAKPILVGPFNENFAEPVRILESAGACLVCEDLAMLERECDRLLGDPEACQQVGRSGRETVLAQRGATDRIVTEVLRLIERG